MNSLMAKYFNQPPADEQCVGHTLDGFPVRGDRVPSLTDDEFLQMPVVADYHFRMFHMWDAAHCDAFRAVMDLVANGGALVVVRREFTVADIPDAPGGHLKLWLEWKQFYGQAVPPGYRPVDPPAAHAHIPLRPRG